MKTPQGRVYCDFCGECLDVRSDAIAADAVRIRTLNTHCVKEFPSDIRCNQGARIS